MAIDWNKPIELSDGTPAKVVGRFPSQKAFDVLFANGVRTFKDDGSAKYGDAVAPSHRIEGRTVRNVPEVAKSCDTCRHGQKAAGSMCYRSCFGNSHWAPPFPSEPDATGHTVVPLAQSATKAPSYKGDVPVSSFVETKALAIAHQILSEPDVPETPEEDTANPKDRMGALKSSTLSVIPASAVLALGGVMSLGAKKYGRFNWREKAVKASVYTDAAMRHLMAWVDGEDIDRDPDPVTGEPRGSMESHLANVMACMCILIDAKARGQLVDDRDVHEVLTGSAAQIIRDKAATVATATTH